MLMQERSMSSIDYRFGFQGQELDNEIKGKGNSVNYKYRMHSPRVGRFFAVDPLAAQYSYNSPYAFSENRLIDALELEGLEIVIEHLYNKESNSFVKTDKYINNALRENVNLYIYKDADGKITRQVYKSFESDRTYVASAGQVDQYTLISTFNGEAKSSTISQVDDKYKMIWEGEADGANLGGKYGGEHGWNNGGKQLFFGTIGIITAPITLAAAGTGTVVGTIWNVTTGTFTLVNSIDDLGGVVVSRDQSNYESLVQSFTDDPAIKEAIANVKAGGQIVTFANGGWQLWQNGAKNADGVATLVGFGADAANFKDNFEEVTTK